MQEGAKQEEKILGVKKNVFFLGIVSLFNDFSQEMIYSALPAFFISVLKAGSASLGLIEGIANGLANILKVFSGRISDKLNTRKAITVFGYSLSVITRPFYNLVNSVFGVFVLRAIDRTGKG